MEAAMYQAVTQYYPGKKDRVNMHNLLLINNLHFTKTNTRHSETHPLETIQRKKWSRQAPEVEVSSPGPKGPWPSS